VAALNVATLRSRLAPALLALLLAACAGTPAPVFDRSPGAVRDDRPAGDVHVVQRGDTVYGIAFRNGLDWRDFAAWNGVGPPYTIFIGQRLRLTPPPGWRGEPAPGSAVAATPTPSGTVETRPVDEPDRPARIEPLGQDPAPAPARPQPSAVEPGQPSPGQLRPAPAATPAPAPAPETRTPATDPPASPSATTPQGPPAAMRSVGGVAWRWPAQGPLLRTFAANDPLRQGIDIAGQAGDPVYAAADGEVVYSGSGLVGYGELVIIKHSEQYLSAYGHNRRRLVSEGQQVRAGQQIAEMGRTGTDREKLHFEIRRGGRPVNPLDHLPTR
jgi:lipoprotein NlpD